MSGHILIIYYLIINILSFIIWGIDKRRARFHYYRIPEKVLFLSAFIGGAGGAFLGMIVLRHKTKHFIFWATVPLLLLIQLSVIVFILK
jgi:uncharacterized membrane protein YsdA (DUF1294 family)